MKTKKMNMKSMIALLTWPEFKNFKILADRKHVDFKCELTNNNKIYVVECDREFMLDLGF